MNAITRLGKTDVQRLLSRYEVGELLDHWPAAHGIENSNYFLRTRLDGALREWVLTVLEQASYAGAVLAPLLDLCQAAGLPVAPVVRNAAGGAHETLHGKAVLLTPRLPGEHAAAPTAAQVKALGAAVAQLHLATQRPAFIIPPYPRDEAWLRQQAESVRPHLRRTTSGPTKGNDRPSPGQHPATSPTNDDVLLLDALLGNATAALRQAAVDRLPGGVIHGDLFRDNVLFEGDRLTGLLDFHHAAVGYRIYDVAVAANDWCSHPDGRLNASQANALLAAYHQIRPLAAAELDAFPGFMAYAALAFWLSRLSAAGKAQSGLPVRMKDPEEFRRIGADRAAQRFRAELQSP